MKPEKLAGCQEWVEDVCEFPKDGRMVADLRMLARGYVAIRLCKNPAHKRVTWHPIADWPKDSTGFCKSFETEGGI
jgi:hypothetical protein